MRAKRAQREKKQVGEETVAADAPSADNSSWPHMVLQPEDLNTDGVCVCARARARARLCVCACPRVYVCVSVSVSVGIHFCSEIVRNNDFGILTSLLVIFDHEWVESPARHRWKALGLSFLTVSC